MISNAHNTNSGAAPRTDTRLEMGSVEATLHLIAQLPAPRGLEDRVIAGINAAPRKGKLLQWPSILQPGSSWMRSAAAAAIVFVVAGGCGGIYTQVQPSQPSKVIVMPRAGAIGGFSSAGAMRTPQTINGPVLAKPVTPQDGSAKSNDSQSVPVKPLKTPAVKVLPISKMGSTDRTAEPKASAR